MIVYENMFFAVQQFETNKYIYLDVIRKQQCLQGNTGALIEVLSKPLVENCEREIIILTPVDDHYLLKDIQLIGLTFIGYLTNNSSDSEEITLWNGSIRGSILNFTDLKNKSEEWGKPVRCAMEFTGNIIHDPSISCKEYVYFSRQMEKYYLGLTLLKSKYTQKDRPVSTTTKKSLDNNDSFDQITQARKSAELFDSKIDKNTVQKIIQDSYATREVGTRPFGVAGGIGAYDLYLSMNNVNGFKNGLYKVCHEDDSLSLYSENNYSELISKGTFNQTILENVKIWVIVAADPNELMTKYGKRGYQFMYLDTGGLLQQMHLSCTSKGIDYRIVGGFDHDIIESIIENCKLITCMAAIG